MHMTLNFRTSEHFLFKCINKPIQVLVVFKCTVLCSNDSLFDVIHQESSVLLLLLYHCLSLEQYTASCLVICVCVSCIYLSNSFGKISSLGYF